MWQLQEESQTVFFLSLLAENSFLLILKNVGLPKSLIHAGYFAKKVSGNKWDSNL